MIRFSVIGSGSSANAYLFSYEGSSILIDCGFTKKELIRRAGLADISLDSLRAVLVSHTHSDHTRGVGAVSRALDVPVYIHELVDPSVFGGRKVVRHERIRVGDPFLIGPFRVTAFELEHDAPHAINYHISAGSSSCMVATDTGRVSESMFELMRSADVLFLEANYDERMLQEGPYPYFLKKRIASDVGHLSNEAALEVIRRLSSGLWRPQLYLCHLSSTNNDPQLLRSSLTREFGETGTMTVCEKGMQYMGCVE